jgi:DNA-binding transcriptional ArsR family regulator
MTRLGDPERSMIDVDVIHKALANPLRRQILRWLRDPAIHFAGYESLLLHGVPFGAIHEHTQLSQSTVSTHLAILHRAGLVSGKRVGQWVFLTRNEEVIGQFVECVKTDL